MYYYLHDMMISQVAVGQQEAYPHLRRSITKQDTHSAMKPTSKQPAGHHHHLGTIHRYNQVHAEPDNIRSSRFCALTSLQLRQLGVNNNSRPKSVRKPPTAAAAAYSMPSTLHRHPEELPSSTPPVPVFATLRLQKRRASELQISVRIPRCIE